MIAGARNCVYLCIRMIIYQSYLFFSILFLTWPKQHTTTSRTDVTGVYFLQLVSGKNC